MKTDVREKVAGFFARYPVQKIPKGQILVQAGDDPEGIYYMESGKVQQYDISYRGDEVVVNIFQQPAFFPMFWAVNKTPNRYFFQTLTDTKVRQAPSDDVVEFLQNNPDVLWDLLARLYSGMDGLVRRMAHLMGGSAKSRVLFELLIESKRFGVKQSDNSYKLTVNGGELASRTGLTRETVSRQMRALKEQGLIEISRGGLVLKDPAVIEEKLGTSL